MPIAPVGTAMREAILVMSEKGFGTMGIVEPEGGLVGIITDGDLRRHLDDGLLRRPVDEIMNRRPKTIASDILAGAAVEAMQSAKISALFVVDDGRPVGIIHMHDLLRAGVS